MGNTFDRIPIKEQARGIVSAQRSVCALVCLVLVGAASVQVMAQGNTTMQLASLPQMRGRVMALWLVAFLGTTPIGGPAVGWVANTLGARWGLIVGALACFVAAGVGLAALARYSKPAPVG